MNHLFYKPSGDHHGKPRVFFASHPEDFGSFFDMVYELLRKYNDCTVWYEDSSALLPEEELRDQLGEMQLVVMLVTTRLLTRSSRAMELVRPFALERHIPILPLMMESGLDDLFSAKFGDLQYLQPENPDPTAAPFEQKLENYLSGVLVGEELAQQVREAFDAYIFLSYRKKDRKYAQELMWLIHQTKHFRDIAIWYDEYLVPGESFNDAIRKALEKSELFTLVVTPSLLEQGNYVMREEYPAAQKAEKPILPVEMEETDKTTLEECYQQIPHPVRPNQGTELNETMLEYLHRIALSENDSDPQHNFLIGLAYLDGIDVEVDNQRALSLITGSAETGHEAAMRKLVFMYETGKGVERDYHAGVQWREKLVELLRKRYQESGSEENYRGLFNALWEVGDALQSLGQPEKARVFFEEMKGLAEHSPLKDAFRDLSRSYRALGDIEIDLWNPEQAKIWYEKCLEMCETLVEDNKSELDQCFLGMIYDRLGGLENELWHPEQGVEWYAQVWGRPEEAKKWYEKSRSAFETLAAESQTADIRWYLGMVYYHLGGAERALHRWQQSKTWYEKALALYESLAETDPENARLGLSSTYIGLGYIEYVLDQPLQAKAWYEKCLAVREATAAETNTVEDRRSLAEIYFILGDFEECLAIWEKQEPERLKHKSQAKVWYEKRLAIEEVLAEETKSLKDRENLAGSFSKLGAIESDLGHRSQAKAWYEKCLVIEEALVSEPQLEGEKLASARNSLSTTYDLLGLTEQSMGHQSQAKAWYEKRLAIDEALTEEDQTFAAWMDLSDSYERMGQFVIEMDRFEEGKVWYEKCLKVREMLVEETHCAESYNALAGILFDLGQLYYPCYRDLLDPFWGILPDRYCRLGDEYASYAQKYLKRAYDIWSMLVEECPGRFSFAADNRDYTQELLDDLSD